MRSQENNTVSATKEIIETHVALKHYYNYFNRTIEMTTDRVNLQDISSAKANCAIDELTEGWFTSFWSSWFSQNVFKGMLYLGLSFIHVVGVYKIYTECIHWKKFQNYH